MVEKITSFQNPRIKLLKKLRDKKGRDQENRFVIDDARDLQRALARGYEIDFALYCPALDRGGDALDTLASTPVYEVSRDLMEKASYRENPGALLAVMKSPPTKGEAQLEEVSHPLILALVNLLKPGNIGALLRSADALGFGAILLIDTALDLYNPNIIRSSTGACFLGNVYLLTSEQALRWLKANGYRILSAVVEGETSLFEARLEGKLAVVLGREDEGLSGVWLDRCDLRVRIPMVGKLADSLNVSVSGTILMYEVLRQRQRL
jgi:TrmH family RNA methyltransferase